MSATYVKKDLDTGLVVGCRGDCVQRFVEFRSMTFPSACVKASGMLVSSKFKSSRGFPARRASSASQLHHCHTDETWSVANKKTVDESLTFVRGHRKTAST